MESTLYIYVFSNLSALQERLSDYTFYSISHYLLEYNNISALEQIDLTEFDHAVIDISNLVVDGSYYRLFVEQYLIKLQLVCEDIHFCLQVQLLADFKKKYPYVFEQDMINEEFAAVTGGETQKATTLEEKTHILQILYAYRQIESLRQLCPADALGSLAELINSTDGVLVRYDMESILHIITQKRVQYIDISSVIKAIKVRTDWALIFEIMITSISRFAEVHFCIEDSLSEDALSFFPMVFAQKVMVNNGEEIKTTTDDSQPIIDVDKVCSMANAICEQLKGHDNFKKDFKRNLLKFEFLNRMGERKILSILLCGDSGIGKTEFAKIASKVLYSGQPLVKVNFGNYSTDGVLNSLIGSPLGYVGSEEGGELINKIESSKTKVILIDEFEKATPSVYNFFYELLEDGKFTDRHGVEHNLNGYIIVFTSNMDQTEYQKHIPDSLKSRFDMVYYFVELPREEKRNYIYQTATDLIEKISVQFHVQVLLDSIKAQLDALIDFKNLRDIKREIENVVFDAFYKQYPS